MRLLSFGMLACACVLAAGTGSGYQPAKAPLMTVWGEKMTPETAWRGYPRPAFARAEWENLNGLWEYAVNSRTNGMPQAWAGKILVPFAIESALSGVGRLMQPEEQLWYRRTFEAAPKPGERLLLHFGGVDFRTQVFVNGVEATDVPHDDGILPFSLDITPFVKAGANELVVEVWDPTGSGGSYGALGKQSLKPSGCFYTRVSGIWQTVWLETVPATHLTGYRVATDIDKGTVAVTLEAEGNLMAAKASVAVLKDGKRLAEGTVAKWGEPVTLQLENPALWSPDSPALYDLELTLEADGAKDSARGYFGMRKIERRRDAHGVMSIFLNNKKTFLIGTLDQGWWPDGLLTPPSDEAMAYDINLLKSCGFNMMRKHIKVEPLRYYYLCDKLGILVWQDMPSGFGNADDRYAMYRRDLKGMLDLLQPATCIGVWVPYNEGWGEPARAKANASLSWVQRHDQTRLVDGPSGWNDFGVGDFRDRHAYPGPGMFDLMPERVSVLGEFGGLGFPVKEHLWMGEKSWGYVQFADGAALAARYRQLMKNLARLASRGLCASVYTQTTDVEGEVNGLATYDRKVVKLPVDELAKLHRQIIDISSGTRTLVCTELLPTSREVPAEWAYTFTVPTGTWTSAEFDASAWAKGPAGFGNKVIADDKGIPEARVRTRWESKEIWMRRAFDVAEIPAGAEFSLTVFHDEDAEIYLNGVCIAKLGKYVASYVTESIPDQAAFKAALRQGRNVLAVHAANKLGGAYIDVGLAAESLR